MVCSRAIDKVYFSLEDRRMSVECTELDSTPFQELPQGQYRGYRQPNPKRLAAAREKCIKGSAWLAGSIGGLIIAGLAFKFGKEEDVHLLYLPGFVAGFLSIGSLVSYVPARFMEAQTFRSPRDKADQERIQGELGPDPFVVEWPEERVTLPESSVVTPIWRQPSVGEQKPDQLMLEG